MGRYNLLIVQPQQFGYLTDSWELVPRFSSNYNIKVVSGYSNRMTRDSDIDITYIKKRNRIVRRLTLIYRSVILGLQSHRIILYYFPFCSVLAFFRTKVILDIRTSWISKNRTERAVFNFLMSLEARLFRTVVVINDDVANYLGIKAYHVIGVGAKKLISTKAKAGQVTNILYIGTLFNRNIDQLLDYLIRFMHEKNEPKFIVHVVADIDNNEGIKLKSQVSSLVENKNIIFHGFLSHNEVIPIMSRCDVGLSWIPQTQYFDLQPPTKTYEYIVNELYVLASNTSANRSIISERTGLLFNNNYFEFRAALLRILEDKPRIELSNEELATYTWDHWSRKYNDILIM